MPIEKIRIENTNKNVLPQDCAYILKNESNQKIFVFETRTRHGKPRGNVLIIPPFAVNAHSLFLFSYYFQANGYNVYRFDGINSVGLSTGTMENYTLGQLEKDTSQVIDSLLADSGLPLTILTQSLSFPVGLKYSTYAESISKLISIVGVVDVKDTVERVSEKSLDPYVLKEPSAPKYLTVFGHDSIAQDFVDDIIKNSMSNVQDSISHFVKTNVPVYMISAKDDEYVNYEDVLKCRDLIEKNGKLIEVPDAGHMIGRSLFIMKKLAAIAIECALGEEWAEAGIDLPKLTDVVKAASLEADFANYCESQISLL